MSFLWFIAGGVVVALYVWYRNTKKRMEAVARHEVAQFVNTVRQWDMVEPRTEETFAMALHHVAVYLRRYNDFQADPTGRSLPADRAVLSHNWVKLLMNAGLLNPQGNRPYGDPAVSEFWAVVDEVADAIREHIRRSLPD